MIPQTPTIFCGMPIILMILTIEVTVSLFGISHHLIWSFEEWFILNFFQYLMHRLSEDCADDLSVVCP